MTFVVDHCVLVLNVFIKIGLNEHFGTIRVMLACVFYIFILLSHRSFCNISGAAW